MNAEVISYKWECVQNLASYKWQVVAFSSRPITSQMTESIAIASSFRLNKTWTFTHLTCLKTTSTACFGTFICEVLRLYKIICRHFNLNASGNFACCCLATTVSYKLVNFTRFQTYSKILSSYNSSKTKFIYLVYVTSKQWYKKTFVLAFI